MAVVLAVSVAPAVANASPTVLTTVPGAIEDATSTRVLYRPPGVELQPLKVRDATTGTEVTVPVRAGREVLNDSGRLFDGGVLFFTTTVGGNTTGGELDEWRTGTAASVGLGDATASSLAVAGNFAIWNNRAGAPSTLTRRDLAAATNTTVATDSGNTSNDVAANGDVVFWDSVAPYEVHRWRNGVRTKLSDAPSPAWSTYPVTDGVNTVYRRTPRCCESGTRSIAFSDGTTETVLPGSEVSFDPNPGGDYDAAAGWIAYTRAARAEVWLRAPAGTLTEVSADGGTGAASIVALAEGQVAYRRGIGQLFLAAPGHRPFPTGLEFVDAFRHGDRWYAFSSSELMRLGTDTAITSAPPAGTDDPVAHFEFASTSRNPGYVCKLDGGTVPCGPGEQYTTPETLGDGTHTFTVASTDPDLDETDTTPASVTWTLDRTAPAAFDLVAPPDNAGTGVQPELSWAAADDGTGSGIASYAITIDGVQVGTTAGNVTTFTAPPRGEKPHTWSVRATDKAGNTRDSAARTYVVDLTPPSAPQPVSPDQSATVDSLPTLTWERAVDDGGSGVVGYDVDIDGALTRVTGADTTSYTPAAHLAEGYHEWRVFAIDSAGNRTEGGGRSFQVDTRPPVAKLTASPNPALAGTPVRFDAGGSAPVANPLARFEWDLDGNGSYETDTGATSTAEHTYGAAQDVAVGVRVTDTAGRSDTETVALSVTPAPLPGPPGVSINDGARFTNDPDVTLTARWPSFATRMLVSNDGGFPGAEPRPVATLVPWRLDSGGAERLPKVVYVRYLGGLAGNETYQDDIILDQTVPRILSATLGGGRRIKPNSGLRRYTVRGRATDRTSGLGYLQLTSDRRHPGGRKRYSRTVSLVAKRAPRWIRVIDRAGNRSGWRRLTAGG
jgi:hypothetical protein